MGGRRRKKVVSKAFVDSSDENPSEEERVSENNQESNKEESLEESTQSMQHTETESHSSDS